MTLPCIILILIAFAIACPGTWIMRSLAHKLGVLDAPTLHKTHTRPIPVTGGVAIFLGFALPLIAGLIATHLVPTDLWHRFLPQIIPHLEGAATRTPMALTLLAAVTLLHVTGLVDDRRPLGPYSKLIIQLIAAAALPILFEVRLLELLGPIPSTIITTLWIVAVCNAFNFLDNMDGLTSGIALICAAVLLAAALLSGQWFVAAIAALVVGSVAGFLVFNFPPASIFMGDAGSLVIGYLIAFCSVRITYYNPEAGNHWWAVLTPVIVLAIPLYDLISVTIIRILQGKSPFVGDTQHFSHRLVKRGLSRRAAVIVIWCCTLATALGGIMLATVEAWQALLILWQTAAVLLVLALLEWKSRTPDNQT